MANFLRKNQLPILIAISAFALMSFRRTSRAAGVSYLGRDDLPRGIRNNNPGNIVQSGIEWMGKVEYPTDSRFEQFTRMYYGLRALVRNLKSYYFDRGLKTVRDIITRWAPPTENDTLGYINFVAGYMGVTQDDLILWNVPNVTNLVEAIVIKENGQAAATQYIPFSLIRNVVSQEI